MKTAIYVIAGILVLAALAIQFGALRGKRPTDLGVNNGRLKPPSLTPNSVSSQASLYPDHPQAKRAAIAPLAFKGIAEGVEKVSQMEVLFNLGCHICQGFLFARPMPPAQVEQWLTDTQSGLILPRVGTPPDGQELPPHTAL